MNTRPALAIAAGIILAVFFTAGLLAPVLAPYDPKSRRKTPRNPVGSRSFKLKVRETHGLFIDSNSAPII